LENLLLIIFTINIVFLILHEMDAIYWKEWKIFGISNDEIGRKGFILAHIPIFILLLFGLVYSETTYGHVISIILSGFLLIHFVLHAKSYSQKIFNEVVSFGIITAMLVVSIAQLIITIMILLR
jgi:hypothetical protein